MARAPQRVRRTIRATTLAVGNALRSEPELGEGPLFRLDLFSGETLLMRPIPGFDRGEAYPKVTTDIDITHLIEWLESHGYDKVGRAIVDNCVQAEGHRNRFSSARQWLEGLPAWDQVARLDRFWIDVCGVDTDLADEDQLFSTLRYLHATARCTFIGIVARIMDPGCQLDTVPILEGEQGTFKSSLLRVIARRDEWFSDSMVADLKNKDARQHLPGNLVIELAEMSQVKASQVETTKSFVTTRIDKYRPSYGRRHVHIPRQSVFIGTTNDDHYLFDITGNRRYWPIRCGRIDLQFAEQIMDQLYAEALVAWRADEDHYLDKAVEIIAGREQLSRVVVDPLESFVQAEYVDLRLRRVNDGDMVWIRTSEVIEKIETNWTKKDRALEMRVGAVLRKLGGKKKQLPRGSQGWPQNGYCFTKKSSEEGV